MKKATFLRKMLWLLLIPFITTSCEDKMDEHYDVPDWVPASAWEVLQSGEHGNFSMFLEGVERAGFKPMLEGKNLLTVMAPDDEAFKSYLNQHGYSSVKDIPEGEIKKVIGYHLLYYSYNTENLIDFRPYGQIETDEHAETTAGQYYKHRTKSADVPSVVTDPNTNKEIMVYHLERFLPVFSYKFFATRKIDAKSNYELFYPNSTWTGENGFMASNASVKEYGVIANNGYIHTLSQVIEPLETIYTELKQDEDYSIFESLYETIGDGQYLRSDELTKDYAAAYGVDSLYQYQFSNLPDIALEWPTTSFADFISLTRSSHTIFAPTNTTISRFFNEFWKVGGYSSISEVDAAAITAMIGNMYRNGSMVFPDEMKQYAEKEGEEYLNIDPSSIEKAQMCVNGILYGLNNMPTIPVFNMITRTVYQYKDARSFMYALRSSGLSSSYISKDATYTMLIPTTDQFLASGIYTVYSTQSLEEESEGSRVDIGTAKKMSIMYMHSASIASGKSSELSKTETRVIPTMEPWNYWFINNGKLTNNALFNQQLNPESDHSNIYCNFTLFEKTGNGTTYKFDSPELLAKEENSLTRSLAICSDKRYVYYSFVQLMKAAGLVDIDNATLANIPVGIKFIAFIPSNEAIAQALANNSIPGIRSASFDANGLQGDVYDKEALTEYLNSYIITAGDNAIEDYPYIGSAMKSGKYNTLSILNITTNPTVQTITYTDNGNSLSVQLDGGKKCNIVSTYHYFPFAFSDGCFHLIEDTF